MKQKAMDTKLIARPVVGCLTHSHFWEGPCRAGRREDMTREAETQAADAAFAAARETLNGVSDIVKLLPAIDARY